MLDAGDATRLVTSKRTVCPNGSSKALEEDSKETLIAIIITIAEEAVAETKGTRVEVK